MTLSIVEPPRLAEKLLKATLPAGDVSSAVLGDLREELSTVAADSGITRAKCWYWYQTIAIGARYLTTKRKRARPKSPEGDALLRRVVDHLGHAVRTLRRAPLLTLTATLTLALGVGATAALFAVLNGIVLRPLPYPEPDRLVMVSEDNPGIDIPVGFTSLPNYRDWKRDTRLFESLALFRGRSMSIVRDGKAEYVYGAFVTADFFPTFGLPSALGRATSEEESVPGRDGVVVLADGAWQRLFGGDPSIVGREIIVDGRSRTVVGVMPRGFNAPAGWISPNVTMDLWIPFVMEPDLTPDERNNRSYSAVGRIRPGVTLERARAEMSTIHERLRVEFPEANDAWHVQLVSWHDIVVGGVRRPLYLLFGAVSFLLLIACANVANLELNHLLGRESELSLRMALGARRSRLLLQLATESVVLSLSSAAAGVLLCVGVVKLVVSLHPGKLPRMDDVAIDPVVIAAACGLTLVTAVVSVVGPALHVMRRQSALEIGRGGLRSFKTKRHRLQSVVVVVQLALSMVLVVGSALLARSFLNLNAVSPGFEARGVLTGTVALSWNRVSSLPERAAYVRDVLDELGTLPGVERVAMINSLPLSGSNQYQQLSVAGYSPPDPTQRPAAAIRGVSPGYFAVMRIPLIAGRDFDDGDLAEPHAVIVSETFAEFFLPGERALDKQLMIGDDDRSRTVIGIVGDVRHWGLDAHVIPEVYQPYSIEPLTSKSFVIRTPRRPESLVAVVRDTMISVDPDQPLRDVRPMTAYVDAAVAPARFHAVMMTAATLIGLALASVGLFSVMAYTVTERRHEIGIRMALGADRGNVRRLVLGRALRFGALGIGSGLVVALTLARLVAGLLFGVSPVDGATYAASAAGLLAVSAAASYLPAARASRLDPASTLRGE